MNLQPFQLHNNPNTNPKSDENLRVLKFRKYLTLPRSDLHLLYSTKAVNPIKMRNTIKKFLKTKLIAFKILQSDWLDHAEYICSHIRNLTRDKDPKYVPKMTDKKKLYNFLKRFKNLESLKVYTEEASPTLLRSIGCLHQLKFLHLVLDGYQMRKISKKVRDLNCLQYVPYISIKYEECDQNITEQILATFCQHLMKLKSLQRIELDLQDLSNRNNVPVLESVLQCIGEANIDFHIKLDLRDEMLKIDGIRSILARTDTLVLQYYRELLTYERLKAIQQGYRVLHFRCGECDFPLFINACSSLQTLWLETRYYHRIAVPKQFSFPKTLKDLFIIFPFMDTKEANNLLSSLVPEFEHGEILNQLFFAVSFNQLRNIKWIENPTKYGLTVRFPWLLSNIDLGHTLRSPITTMGSLRSLKLDFEDCRDCYVKFVQNILDSLPQHLERFEMIIRDSSSLRIFNLIFPFEVLNQVTEFRLDLCLPLSTDALRHFTKEFVKMKELEVMVVKGKCFSDKKFKVQNIEDRLTQMKKIRDVQVWIGGDETFNLKDYQRKIQEKETNMENCQIKKRFRNW